MMAVVFIAGLILGALWGLVAGYLAFSPRPRF
jgi:hypothetical protein